MQLKLFVSMVFISGLPAEIQDAHCLSNKRYIVFTCRQVATLHRNSNIKNPLSFAIQKYNLIRKSGCVFFQVMSLEGSD